MNSMNTVRILAISLAIFAVADYICAPNTKCNINEDPSMITAKVGETFDITLDSNPSTGYSWKLSDNLTEGIVKLMNSSYTPPETQRKGGGGKEIWRFKAVAAGKTTITLEYVRPWEKDKPPAKKSIFEVIIQQ